MRIGIVKHNEMYWRETLYDFCNILGLNGVDTKQDFLLAVNHTREHFGYEGKLPWVCWIQDRVTPAQVMAEKFNKNESDYMIGYVDTLKGFDPSRCIYMPMLVSPTRCKPIRTPKLANISYVSHKGHHAEDIIDKSSWPLVAEMRSYMFDSVNTPILNPDQVLEKFKHHTDFYDVCSKDPMKLELVYWCIWDGLYRQKFVLDYMRKGYKVVLYGKGWHSNPYFKKYAVAKNVEGQHISKAHNTGEYALHISQHKGNHQRPIEIMMSGAKALCPTLGSRNPEAFDRENYVKAQKEMLTQIVDAIIRKEKNFKIAPVLTNIYKHTYGDIYE